MTGDGYCHFCRKYTFRRRCVRGFGAAIVRGGKMVTWRRLGQMRGEDVHQVGAEGLRVARSAGYGQSGAPSKAVISRHIPSRDWRGVTWGARLRVLHWR